MRISDWSSDVCSSDLRTVTVGRSLVAPSSVCLVAFVEQEFAGHGDLDAVALGIGLAFHLHVEIDRRHAAVAEVFLDQFLEGDRKSVVKGKSVKARVSMGGRRRIK